MSTKLVKFGVVLMMLAVSVTSSGVYAAVETHLEKTLQIDGSPLDVVVSQDGKFTFVLTDSGKVLIYDQDGNLSDTIEVGTHVARIALDPEGERLYAASPQKKTVDIIELAFIRQIPTQGSPFKGPLDAPVTIAVFSDFQ